MTWTDFFVCVGCGGRMRAETTGEETSLVIEHEGGCPEKGDTDG